jgi:dihydrofolate synthase/folylpolyglutamate synthase
MGVLADKDLEGIVGALQAQIQAWYCAPPAAGRALPRADLEAGLKAAGATRVRGFGALRSALDAARVDAAPGDRILVFGSFMTAAELGPLL